MDQNVNLHSEQKVNRPHNSPIIVGLDIGTTKIAVIAGRKNEYGKLEIVGFGSAPSNGVQHGQVLNIDHAVKAIQVAVGNCFKSNPDLYINDVYVGIAGHHIKSLQTRGDMVRQNPEIEIQRYEIDQLIENQRKTFIPAGDEIIDVIPQDFYVDNFQNIKEPVGHNGVKVGANFHIITGDKNAIRNINRAVSRSDLKTKDLVLQPLASSSAVMNDLDLEAGVAILDIGGGTSDLAVFYEGTLKHTAVIPFGGENITNDIRLGLGLLKHQAEALKKQFGSAIADEAKANAYITINGLKGMPSKQISVKNLAGIIQARMSEILDFVSYHLKQVGLDNRMLNGGIILTGGGSQLKNLIQLTEYVTGLNARLGLPNEHLSPNHIEQLKSPMYSTCLGLVLKGCYDFESNSENFIQIAEQEKQLEIPEQFLDKKSEEEKVVETVSAGVSRKVLNKRISDFWGLISEKLRRGMYEFFKEENDTDLR